MKRLLLFIAAAGMCWADVPRIEFTRLDLTDGRTLINVVVKTYDASSQRVLVIADGKATTVPLSAFPAPFDRQISTTAPRSGSSTMVAPLPPPRPKPPQSVSPASRVYSAPESNDASGSIRSDRELRRHSDAARAKAERYFRYEYNLGSGAVRVRSLDVDAREPEAISGWSGRYRTHGRVLIEYFDSRGWSYSRATAGFEAVTETKANGEIVVNDFTVTSGVGEH